MPWLNGFRSGSQRNSSRQWAKMVIIFSLLQILLISGVHAAGSGGPSGILPLNQGWLFGGEYTVGGEAPAFDDSSFQQITIPHSVVPLGWNNYDNNTWNKVWLYRRHFDLPNSEIAGSLRIFLDFDGVLTITTPTINGYVLPSHSGGYLPFSYEITDYVNKTDNILAVVVDSRWSYVNPEGSPHGPQSVDYLEPGGINRDVALRTVPSSFIKDVFAKPDNVLNDSRQVVVEVTIDSAKAPGAIRIQCQLQDSGEVLSRANEVIAISQSGNRTFTLNITAPGVQLWSPDAPKLYQVVTTLLANDIAIHTFTRNIGFRQADFTKDGFFLNGERFQIFGLDRHQTFPYIGMSAPERLQKRDADLLKELNCNMVRCSHYPQSPHFLDRCDELGIMVWQEVAGWQFIGNASWQEHVVSDVREMIIRDRSRPSVVIWGTQVNESPRQPTLYTQTRQLAHSLDNSRQTSGTETSQSLTDWVGDVFAFDDYRSTDGNAHLLPPLTAFPYLITEAVGALDGPRFFRWIDDQHVQQVQSILHAQVHDIAGGNSSYSGLLAWAGIDYDSLNGNIYANIKWPGVIDTFRVYKPGATFYLTQGHPAKSALIEPAFYWDFGPASPVTKLGKNATIWSNADILEAYIDGTHYATLRPDAANFPHTAHPPFYLDTTELKASAKPELHFDGYVSGEKVVSRTFSGSTEGDRIQINLHDQELQADGIDSTLISFRAVDKYGNPRPYATGDVSVSVSGPGEWVSQLVSLEVTADPPVVHIGQTSKITANLRNGAFPWGENGGVGGAVIRTIAGRPGTITVGISHAILGRDTVYIQAVPSPGSFVASSSNSQSLSDVTLNLSSSTNWTIIRQAANAQSDIGVDDSSFASWMVTPQSVDDWSQPLRVNAAFNIENRPGQKQLYAPISSVLTTNQARNNVGISNDSSVAVANFDGLENSFSSEALSAADLKPGAKFYVGGLTFTWPDVPSGSPDNILSTGQIVLINGTGNTLGFVGASTNSYNGGIGTVFYTDGSSSRFTLELGNYFDTQFLDNTVVATMGYVNNAATGQNHAQAGTLFYSGTPLISGKTVLAVGLPASTAATAINPTNALHIFSIAIG